MRFGIAVEEAQEEGLSSGLPATTYTFRNSLEELTGLLAVLMAEVNYGKRTHSRISKGKRLIR